MWLLLLDKISAIQTDLAQTQEEIGAMQRRLSLQINRINAELGTQMDRHVDWHVQRGDITDDDDYWYDGASVRGK